MKKISLIILLATTISLSAQVTTIINYDFNSGSSYPLSATTTTTGNQWNLAF